MVKAETGLRYGSSHGLPASLVDGDRVSVERGKGEASVNPHGKYLGSWRIHVIIIIIIHCCSSIYVGGIPRFDICPGYLLPSKYYSPFVIIHFFNNYQNRVLVPSQTEKNVELFQ